MYGPLDAPCNDPKKKPNHLVTIVGFGRDNSTGTMINYWLIRNSWGRNWGQDGYMLLQAASGAPGGMCKIASAPYVVASEWRRGAARGNILRSFGFRGRVAARVRVPLGHMCDADRLCLSPTRTPPP